MRVDVRSLRSLVEENGEEVFSTSYDGGSPMHNGCSGVIKFLESYWGYDDNGEFGGPYDSLDDALDDIPLGFGEVDLSVSSPEMSSDSIASRLELEAPPGHIIRINEEEWGINKEGTLVPADELEQEEEINEGEENSDQEETKKSSPAKEGNKTQKSKANSASPKKRRRKR